MSHSLQSSAPDLLHWRQAYRQSMTAHHLLSDNRLFEVSLDIPTAARIVLARMPRIREQSRRIASNLGDFDLASIDKLDRDVRAMGYAHWLYQSAQMSLERIKEWLDERPSMQGQGPTESSEATLVEVPRSGDRHRPEPSLSASLAVVHFVHSISSAEVNGLSECELARSIFLEELAALRSERDDDLLQLDAALRLNRQRAFTAFMLGYDQVRRAIHFVRWQERDAEEIAPALHRYVARRREHHDPRTSAQFHVGSADVPVARSGQLRRETAS